MIVEFLSEAPAELLAAAAYFEGELGGLGQRFQDEVDGHIRWVSENPQCRDCGRADTGEST